MRNILIPFSGGLDSTYLAYRLLSEGNSVHLVYIDLGQCNQNKIAIEKPRSQHIAGLLSEEFPGQVMSSVVAGKPGMTQFDTWMDNLEGMDPHRYDAIAFGAILDRVDAELDRDDMMEYESRKKKFKNKYGDLSMELPLVDADLSKAEVAQLLPDVYLSQVFSCEFPEFESAGDQTAVHNCGECNPCTLEKLSGIFSKKEFLIKKMDGEKMKIYNGLLGKHPWAANFYSDYTGVLKKAS